jgi:hypothetical protein
VILRIDRSFLLLVAQILDLLPSEIRVFTAKMATTGGLLESGLPQPQFTHNHSGSQVEVTENDALKVLVTVS